MKLKVNHTFSIDTENKTIDGVSRGSTYYQVAEEMIFRSVARKANIHNRKAYALNRERLELQELIEALDLRLNIYTG